MEGFEPALSLIVPFIGLIFLIKICESVVRFVLEKILHFQDETEEILGYILTGILAYGIAYSADYQFFSYLDINFNVQWIAWIMSAGLVAAGSDFLGSSFEFISRIPMNISGVFSLKKPKNKDDEPKG